MERALRNNSNLQGLAARLDGLRALVAKVSLDEASIQQLVDCAWQVSAF